MDKVPKEFFVVSGARYEFEELIERVEKSKRSSEKWELLMKAYNKHLAFERAHSVALNHMRDIEGAGLPQSDSSKGLTAVLQKYRDKIPEVEAVYKKERAKQLTQTVDYTIPNERELRLEDDVQKRIEMFSWSTSFLESEIQGTEQLLTRLPGLKLNPIEKRVEDEMLKFYLQRLKLARAEVKRLYGIYISNFRVYKIL